MTSPFARLRLQLNDSAFVSAIVVFLVFRVLLTLWAIVALAINPLPDEPDEVVRPYLGEPRLEEGAAGLLLGPWQRFDTLRYMRIARAGYAEPKNSVFPPLYPLSVKVAGSALGGEPLHNLIAAIILSNVACLALLVLFFRVVAAEQDSGTARRALLYMVVFPTGFFLFAPYSEPVFLLLSLGSLWAARCGRFWAAGFLGLLASLTRLTGWVLAVPLLYEYITQNRNSNGASHPAPDGPANDNVSASLRFGLLRPEMVSALLPVAGLIAFIVWRWATGLPPLSTIYEQYWYQRTSFPGIDMVTAVISLFFGGAARSNELIALSLDFISTLLLIVTTVVAFRRLGITYGLYSAMLLLFILLPSSDVKPLYSFSRYALAFFPTFMLLGAAGRHPWVNRLILYPSFLLYMYFSGQFFAWGWVA